MNKFKKWSLLIIITFFLSNNLYSQYYAQVQSCRLIENEKAVEIQYVIYNSNKFQNYNIEMYWLSSKDEAIIPSDDEYYNKVVRGANNFDLIPGGNEIKYIRWNLDYEVNEVVELVQTKLEDEYFRYGCQVEVALIKKTKRGRWERIIAKIDTKKGRYLKRMLDNFRAGKSNTKIEYRIKKYEEKKRNKLSKFLN